MNSKEQTLLEYIRTRYKNTSEVKLRIPTNDYDKIGIKDSEELGKILMALSERNYVYLNPTKGKTKKQAYEDFVNSHKPITFSENNWLLLFKVCNSY